MERVDRSLIKDVFVKDKKRLKALGTSKYKIEMKDLLPFVNSEKLVKMLVDM